MSGGEVLPSDLQHAYRLLVRHSGTDAEGLAADAGVTVSEAIALLEALHEKGLATPGPRFHALPPDIALGGCCCAGSRSCRPNVR
jgi:hypothetical protein